MKEALVLYAIGVWLALLIAWPAGLLTEKRAFAYILAWPVVAVWRLYRLFFNKASVPQVRRVAAPEQEGRRPGGQVMGGGITGTNICLHARGFIPQELTCDLRVKQDKGLPLWKRLWHAFRGDYDCMTEGTLPCPIADTYNKEKLQ